MCLTVSPVLATQVLIIIKFFCALSIFKEIGVSCRLKITREGKKNVFISH